MLSAIVFLFCAPQLHGALSWAEQFKQVGYVEMCNDVHGAAAFEALYVAFDEFIEFLQANPAWAQKIYAAKERFIRSKERRYYATDFFGFFDESSSKGRGQIAFYYAMHFHAFVCAHYPEFHQAPALMHFFELCGEMQKSYASIFQQTADDLGLTTIFSATHGQPPILFKVVKYFPSYVATKPHYDGTAFSLFLDSTDNQSLLLAPYQSTFTVDDFAVSVRQFHRLLNQNSLLLIPGTLLTEFSIYPTPHIVMQSGSVRYAAIAFAMRPDYISQNNTFSSLPSFNH